MEFIFCILIGVIIGSIITKQLILRRTGYGYFSMIELEDTEETGDYNIRIRLQDGQPLLDKRQIVLKRE